MSSSTEVQRAYRRSTWAPLRNPLVRALWLGTLASNLGTWVHDMCASWMMTGLRPQPVMQSLIQVAITAPMFVLALPAGALADLFDRRRFLIVTQSFMLVVAALMAAIALSGHMTAGRLVAGTACLAIGTALNSPAWHSLLPTLVARPNLPAAITVNGLALSLGRALGPAVAGLLLTYAQPGWGFALNAASFTGVLITLLWWRPKPPRPSGVRAERFLSALRVGLAHVRHSPRMRNAFLRCATFTAGSQALWALLALHVRVSLGLKGAHYGGMVGLFGLGAVLSSTFLLPRWRERWSLNRIVDVHWLGFTVALATLALTPATLFGLAFPAMFLAGGCSICILSCFHVAVQSLAPAWVRARAMSVFLFSYFAAASGGAALWGWAAQGLGLRWGMMAGALFLLSTLPFSAWVPVRSGEDLDLFPSNHWPEPEPKLEFEPEDGPVLVTVEYFVAEENRDEFRRRMAVIRTQRLGNGVLRWGLFEDLEQPGAFREVYLEESWSAHLRQHERVTAYEAQEAAKAYRLHEGPEMPRVAHLLMCGP